MKGSPPPAILPFFSIITASLNNAATIGATLHSVAGQSFRDFEHIVLDGGSDDGTLSVLKRYSNAYDLRWWSEPDEGISDALNKGVRVSIAPYLLVLQADDQLTEEGTLEKVYGLLQSQEYDIYSFPVEVSFADTSQKLHSPSAAPLLRYRFKNVFRHQGTFVHRRVHERIGEYDTGFCISMDYDFFYRALQYGCRYAIGNYPVARMGGAGVSRTQRYKRIREEASVQRRNEKNPAWRTVQAVFRSLYLPYHYLLDMRMSKTDRRRM